MKEYTNIVQNNPERIGYYWKLPNEFEELIESSHAHEIEQEFLKKYGCLVDKLERGCINVEYKRNNDSPNKVTELYKNKKTTKNDNTEDNVVKFSIPFSLIFCKISEYDGLTLDEFSSISRQYNIILIISTHNASLTFESLSDNNCFIISYMLLIPSTN